MSLENLLLPKVIGHRGACGYAPENTLASMHIAQQLGAEWVEFDVMLTQDNVAIIQHDLTLNRTTNGKGKVAATAYAKIASLDAGSWFEPKFAGERVPTLSELLRCLAKLNLQINLEIKPTPGKEIETATQAIQILQREWPYYSSALISSAAIKSLTTVRALDAKLALGLITDRWPKNWESLLNEFNGISLHVKHTALTPQRVQTVKQTGRLVLAYTVNDADRATELFAWGVDAVFSDYPDRILAKISAAKPA